MIALLALLACTDSTQDLDGDGISMLWGDCDDTDPTIFPGAEELCDGIDNDCDGTVDGADATGSQTYFVDGDDDGFGEAAVYSCTFEVGWAVEGGDCDDEDDARFPGNEEHCNGVDDDCDGSVDEEPVDSQSGYLDLDRDGWGGEFVWTCDPPEGLIEQGEDCDDTDPAVNPDADEVCATEWDDDCDGGANDLDAEGPVDGAVWYWDLDEDHLGDPADPRRVCDSPPEHVVDNALDCEPETPSEPCGWKEVDVGRFIGCALNHNGAIACWGVAAEGSSTSFTEAYAGGDFGTGWTDLSVDDKSALMCALDEQGSVTCWGDGSGPDAVPGNTAGYEQVAAKNSIVCARAGTTVDCWTTNAGVAWSPPALTHVECGANRCMGIDATTGNVVGQFGAGGPQGTDLVDLGVGQSWACALASDGSSQCFCVAGSCSPEPAPGGLASLDLANSFGAGLTDDGACVSWGSNVHGCPTNVVEPLRQATVTWTGGVVVIDANGELHCNGGADGWAQEDCPE